MSSYLDQPDSDKEDDPVVHPPSELSDEEIQLRVDALKAQGNEAFAANDFEVSADFYGQAIKILKDNHKPANSILHLNRAAAHLGAKNYVKALHDSNVAAEADPALMSMSKRAFRTKQAIKAFETCLECASLPASKKAEVRSELAKANRLMEQQDAETPPADLSRCAPS